MVAGRSCDLRSTVTPLQSILTRLVVLMAASCAFVVNANLIDPPYAYFLIGIAYLTVITISFSMLCLDKYSIYRIDKNILWSAGFLIFCFLIVSLFNRVTLTDVVYRGAQVLSVVLVVVGAPSFVDRKILKHMFSYLGAIFLLIFIALWLQSDADNDRYLLFSFNPNVLGIYLAMSGFFLWLTVHESAIHLRRIIAIMIIGIVCSLLFFIGARSALIMLVVSVSFLGILNLKYRKLISWSALSMLLLLHAVFPFLYIWSSKTDFGNLLNSLSREIFSGANLYSGREVIWERIIEKVLEKPFIGYGLGAKPEDFWNTSLSSHGFVTYIALESGLVGLVATTIFIFLIWRSLLARDARWEMALLFAVLVQHLFEAALLGNNLGWALWIWLSVGGGLAIRRTLSRGRHESHAIA